MEFVCFVNFPSIHETNFSDYINVSSISECVVSWEIRRLTSSEPFYSDEIPDLIMENRSAIPFCYKIHMLSNHIDRDLVPVLRKGNRTLVPNCPLCLLLGHVST
jgi:hypothetical protein